MLPMLPRSRPNRWMIDAAERADDGAKEFLNSPDLLSLKFDLLLTVRAKPKISGSVLRHPDHGFLNHEGG